MSLKPPIRVALYMFLSQSIVGFPVIDPLALLGHTSSPIDDDIHKIDCVGCSSLGNGEKGDAETTTEQATKYKYARGDRIC